MASFENIRAVERTMLVLRELNRRSISTVKLLHHETGLPSPTLVRILETLESLGYVKNVGRRVGYTLTEKIVELSGGFHGFPVIYKRAEKILSDLTDRVLWPAALATLDGDAMVVRLSTIPRSPLSHTHSTLQKRLELLSRAHGRAYLAFCPKEERDRLMKLLVKNGYSRMDASALEERMRPILNNVRQRGFAVRDHEIDPQTATVAMPVMVGKRVVSTVGLTFFRSVRSSRDELVKQLAIATRQIAALDSSGHKGSVGG
ncbi:DNA-binding transcriptional regulator [Hoeflea poritis]|uniref:DNA-binding transcriptional regulator n=1 Tax=Hoeflea poritis TaxID=2993659 RepID=A0ABT4VSY2_9HYPH|nr:DNA-binding transcriptional regulator [Hoeflea poritis]MDA4847816.1 DNA-binding transcriptional regulator [Hoeflea poritis]